MIGPPRTASADTSPAPAVAAATIHFVDIGASRRQCRGGSPIPVMAAIVGPVPAEAVDPRLPTRPHSDRSPRPARANGTAQTPGPPRQVWSPTRTTARNGGECQPEGALPPCGSQPRLDRQTAREATMPVHFHPGLPGGSSPSPRKPVRSASHTQWSWAILQAVSSTSPAGSDTSPDDRPDRREPGSGVPRNGPLRRSSHGGRRVGPGRGDPKPLVPLQRRWVAHPSLLDRAGFRALNQLSDGRYGKWIKEERVRCANIRWSERLTRQDPAPDRRKAGNQDQDRSGRPFGACGAGLPQENIGGTNTGVQRTDDSN